MNVYNIYQELSDRFGPQGWWPVHAGEPRPGFDPRFEICVGTILTQNTAWTNVEKAIESLYEHSCLDAETLLAVPDETLKQWIRPAGYFNQKTKKLKLLAENILSRPGQNVFTLEQERCSLLNLWGVGRETADSILLYAYDQPIFVVDAYTRRFLSAHGRHDLATADYDLIRYFFELNLPRDAKVYNEFHALIVAWGKQHG